MTDTDSHRAHARLPSALNPSWGWQRTGQTGPTTTGPRACFTRACRILSAVLASLALAAAGCAGSPSLKGQKLPPGFQGKDCALVAPELSYEQMRRGPPGTVKAHVRVVDGAVASVVIRSGPQAYRQPVIDAIRKYTCKGQPTFEADQSFTFGVDPLRQPAR